jgi:hypothetical protein
MLLALVIALIVLLNEDLNDPYKKDGRIKVIA